MYDNEDNDNEFSNGGNGRFDGLADRFKKGGNPRSAGVDKDAAIADAIGLLDSHFGHPNSGSLTTFGDDGLQADIATLELVREFKAVKEAKEAADLVAKELNRVYDFLRLAMVPERFESDGISIMKVDGVGRVQLAGDIYAGIIKSRTADAHEWLSDNGRGDLVKPTVNNSSLKAVLKKMLETGEEIPEELFKAEPFTRASIVRG